MREIKFRAWDGEQMFYTNDDSTIVLDKNGWELGIADYDWDVHGASSRKTNHVLMQFTGLHDRNGKEIYEGDICKMIDWWVEGDYTEYGFIGVVKFEDGEFGLHGNKEYQYESIDKSSIHNKKIEVVGNIYENTELLQL